MCGGGGEGVLRGRNCDPWMAVIPEFTHSINDTIRIVSNTYIFLFILEANNKIINSFVLKNEWFYEVV